MSEVNKDVDRLCEQHNKRTTKIKELVKEVHQCY